MPPIRLVRDTVLSPNGSSAKDTYKEAFSELCRLRMGRVQATRDLYYIHVLPQVEGDVIT